jgi:hypothetical protein
MNMAVKQYMNHLILETTQPLTTLLDSVWKGTIEGNGCQVGGPDSLGRVDEESTG